MTQRPDDLSVMNEAELRQAVLIPLFEEMGYHDVEEYHGGAKELGKDIVMWKPNDLGVRRNYAVVVKAEKITGQVSGRSDATKVFMQVKQCFGDPYIDPVSGDEREVHRVYVVSSGTIKKESRDAIMSALGDMGKNTDFIRGRHLERLVEEHLSLRTVSEKLSEVKEALEDLHPDWDVVSRTSADGISYSIEPKDRDTGFEDPPTITTSFEFPDTEKGREAKRQLREHIERGVPVSIGEEFVTEVNAPDVVERLLPPLKDGAAEVELGPRQAREILNTKLVLTDDDGHQYSLEPVELRGVRVGTTEAEITNDHQDAPWHVGIILDRGSDKLNFSFKVSGSKANVFSLLRGFEFARQLNKGGLLCVRDIESGLDMLTMEVTEGQVGPAPDPGFIDFLETVVAIQDATGVQIDVPERDIPVEEAEEIYRIRGIVEEGVEELGDGTAKVEINREGLRNILQAMDEEERPVLEIRGESIAIVLDQEIDLGEKIVRWQVPSFEAEYREALESEAESMDSGEYTEVILPIEEESNARALYPKWQ